MPEANFEIVSDNTETAIDIKDEAIERALTICGGMMEAYAKQKCHVDTGLLRNSITFALDGESPAMKAYHAERGEKKGTYDGQLPKEDSGIRSVSVGTNVEYAPYLEFGTVKHPGGDPYIRPAVSDHIEQYKQVIATELKEALK